MHFNKPLFILSLISLVFLSQAAFALTWGDFEYVESGGTVTITGYTGIGGVVTVPETIDNKSVVTIGNQSFLNKTAITSITIPNGVTKIDDGAFWYCTGITSFTIPPNVNYVGSSAFRYTGLTTINIPASVTYIGVYVFTDCANLTSVTVEPANMVYSSQDGVLFNFAKTTLIYYPVGKTGAYSIPDGVITIRGSAFSDCSHLTGITIPDTVTTLGQSAFFFCTSLTSVIIPDSITSLPEYVFSFCYALTDVTIPVGVTDIAANAFRACSVLTTINIPASVINIGNEAFRYSTVLNSAYFYGNAPTMGTGVFDNCTAGFTVYYIADSTGFTNPWNGYPTAVFTPPSTTTTTQPTTTTSAVTTTSTIGSDTTTTTIPAETCELTVSPIRKISFLFFPIPLRIITLTALDDATLSSRDTLDWGTEALRTLSVRVSPRKPGQARAIVLIRPLQLDRGTYDVMFGNCEGTLEVK